MAKENHSTTYLSTRVKSLVKFLQNPEHRKPSDSDELKTLRKDKLKKFRENELEKIREALRELLKKLKPGEIETRVRIPCTFLEEGVHAQKRFEGSLLSIAVDYYEKAEEAYSLGGEDPKAASTLIDVLLEAGADPNASDEAFDPLKKEETLLQCASPFEKAMVFVTQVKKASPQYQSRQALVFIFLKHASDKNPLVYNRNFHIFGSNFGEIGLGKHVVETNILGQFASTRGDTPDIAFIEFFQRAVQKKGWERLDPDIVFEGSTAVANAVKQGRTNTLRWLLKTLGANANTPLRDSQFSSALLLACARLCYASPVSDATARKTIQLLYEAGADITHGIPNKLSPFYLVCRLLDRVVITTLLETFPHSRNVVERYNDQPFSLCDIVECHDLEGECADIVATLQAYGARPSSIPSGLMAAVVEKAGPVHLERVLAEPACTEEVLTRLYYIEFSENVASTSQTFQATIFVCAIINDCFEAARILLRRCSRVAHISTQPNNFFPLDLMLKKQDKSISNAHYFPLLDELLAVLKNESPDELNREHGRSLPLHIVFEFHHGSPFLADFLDRLLAAGAKPWIRSSHDVSALFYSAEHPTFGPQDPRHLMKLIDAVERDDKLPKTEKGDILIRAVEDLLEEKKPTNIPVILDRARPYLEENKVLRTRVVNSAINTDNVQMLTNILEWLKAADISIKELPVDEKLDASLFILIKDYKFKNRSHQKLSNQVEMLHLCLQCGFDPNISACVLTREHDGHCERISLSALVTAILFNPMLVEILLIYGASTNIPSRFETLEKSKLAALRKSWTEKEIRHTEQNEFMTLLRITSPLIWAIFFAIKAECQKEDLHPYLNAIKALLAHEPALIKKAEHGYVPIEIVREYGAGVFQVEFARMVIAHCKAELDPDELREMQAWVARPPDFSAPDTRCKSREKWIRESGILVLANATSQPDESSSTGSPPTSPTAAQASLFHTPLVYAFANGLVRISADSLFLASSRRLSRSGGKHFILVTPGIISWLESEGYSEEVLSKFRKHQRLDSSVVRVDGGKSQNVVFTFVTRSGVETTLEPVVAKNKFKINTDERLYFAPFRNGEVNIYVPVSEFLHRDAPGSTSVLHVRFTQNEHGDFCLAGGKGTSHVIFPAALALPRPRLASAADASADAGSPLEDDLDVGPDAGPAPKDPIDDEDAGVGVAADDENDAGIGVAAGAAGSGYSP